MLELSIFISIHVRQHLNGGTSCPSLEITKLDKSSAPEISSPLGRAWTGGPPEMPSKLNQCMSLCHTFGKLTTLQHKLDVCALPFSTLIILRFGSRELRPKMILQIANTNLNILKNSVITLCLEY